MTELVDDDLILESVTYFKYPSSSVSRVSFFILVRGNFRVAVMF